MNDIYKEKYDERKKAMVGDFEFFLENLNDLYAKYGNKYIAIKDKKVLGCYDTFESAILNTAKTEPMGTFIVQQCSDNIANYTAVFHSNYINLGV